MRIATGTVRSGQVVLDEPLPHEGAEVWVLTRESCVEARLSPEELAELEEGIAEAERGDVIDGEEFFARLRRYG